MSNRKISFKFWSKQRTDNGLRRFIRDFHEEQGLKLPASFSAYNKMLPREEKRKATQERRYPPAPAVLRHYHEFSAAWWNFGYLVEVRIKHPKFTLTADIEAMLRKIYEYKLQKKNRPPDIPLGARPYARQLGIPEHQLIKWAKQLGLSETKESPWSDEEIRLLDELGYKSPGELRRIFKKRGFTRSETAIHLMRKRRMSHKASPYYSLTAFAKLLGVDAHLVQRWAEKGWLKTDNKGTSREHDTRVVHKDWIYEFICRHPNEFQLKKVDQFWFLHIVTRGEVKLTFSNQSEMGNRIEGQLIEKPREFRKKKLKAIEKAGRNQQKPNPHIRFKEAAG